MDEEKPNFLKRQWDKLFGYEEEEDDWYDEMQEEGEHKDKREDCEDENDENNKQETAKCENIKTSDLSINLLDCDNHYTLYTMIPGVDPKNVEVEITHELVTISLNMAEIHSTSIGKFIYQELESGIFERTVMLPAEIDIDNYSAKTKNGMLELKLYKINKKRTLKVDVS